MTGHFSWGSSWGDAWGSSWGYLLELTREVVRLNSFTALQVWLESLIQLLE